MTATVCETPNATTEMILEDLEPAHDLPAGLLDSALTVSQFWALVDDSAGPDACHPWTGYTEDGYGRFFFAGKMIGAHELVVLFTTGEIRPTGWDTRHRCNNPICCNARHLCYGTRQDNVDDMTLADRHARGSKNGQARLTEKAVLEIRHRAANGASGKALAAEYDVSAPLITEIVRGNRWKHVGGPIRSGHGNTKHGKFTRRKAA